MTHAYYGFVDGGYLRSNAKRVFGKEFLDPAVIVQQSAIEMGFQAGPFTLERTLYFDAIPDPSDKAKPIPGKEPTGTTDETLEKYFNKVESQSDTEVRFGYVRGRPDGKERRQKAVDIQLAVDMLVGAFERVFKLAVLVSGDADFVPMVYEAKRRGVRVLVVGFETTMNELLMRAADRHLFLSDRYKSYELKF